LRKGLIIVFILAVIGMLGTGCASGRNFNARLREIVKPYTFSTVRWELGVLGEAVRGAFSGKDKSNPDVSCVTEYFSLTDRIKKLKSQIETAKARNNQSDASSLEEELAGLEAQKAALENRVERTLEEQIEETFKEQGIFHPFDRHVRVKVTFPPLDFKLGRPPHVLVVSPRDRIESIREVTLRQDMTTEQMERIEAEADALNVSSLVVNLGGFSGTYPTFVINDASLRFTVDTVAEEWLHQYLAFKPLGFRYLLDLTGIARNYEIATMNETVASMVSKEIGALLTTRYYPLHSGDAEEDKEDATGFSFSREMREIRRVVDTLLAEGKVREAEKFMEEKRLYLLSKGYYIRKLNQAYFAFHGTYADRPTSISPIGAELRELRNRSASLKEFLDTVSAMTSRQDLQNALKERTAGG